MLSQYEHFKTKVAMYCIS